MLLAPSYTLIFGAVLALWLTVLTFWLFKINAHYKSLVKKSDKKTLVEILKDLLAQSENTEKRIIEAETKLASVIKDAEKYIQKVGLVRFNPYRETGGNQSFALCLLDKEGQGVVILSLHGREGTRIYIKSVVKGKSSQSLSKEEKQAVDNAK